MRVNGAGIADANGLYNVRGGTTGLLVYEKVQPAADTLAPMH
jgi:hypothetical protein